MSSPPRHDRQSVDRFLDAAASRLTGEWILVGGAAAAAWFLPGRVTEDIVLVPLDEDAARRLELMDLAADLGLPIETVNSAAGYFLRRIPAWRDELEVLRHGNAVIYRPSPTLFLLLKIGRMAEADLDDCLTLVDAATREGWTIDRDRVVEALDRLAAGDAGPAARRRLTLRARLEAT